MRGQDATSEATDFLTAIRPYYFQTGNTHFLRPVADLELSTIPDFGNTSLEKTFVSNWMQVFSDTINNSLGVRPIMYLSKSNANTYWTSTIASEHQFWIAQYKGTGTTQPPTTSDTPLWPAWSFWQWSDGTDAIAQGSQVPGTSVSVDRDVFSGSLAAACDVQAADSGAGVDCAPAFGHFLFVVRSLAPLVLRIGAQTFRQLQASATLKAGLLLWRHFRW